MKDVDQYTTHVVLAAYDSLWLYIYDMLQTLPAFTYYTQATNNLWWEPGNKGKGEKLLLSTL